MILQICKMAWEAIGSNKLRTFLTMLGIIIGVMALVVLVSIADGTASSVSDQISDMGSDYLSVYITDDKENPVRLSEFFDLLEDDAIAKAAPMARTNVTAKSGYTSDTMNLTGTSGEYFDIMEMEFYSGRNLKRTDLDNHTLAVIISYDTAVEFFGRGDSVGETLSLDGKQFQVVGVLSEDDSSLTYSSGTVSGSSDEESSESAVVSLEGYVPYSTLTRMADNVLDITQFYVSSADETSMDAAESALETIMSGRLNDDEDAFTIQNQSEIMEAMENVNNTMSLMIAGIAAISLLVGGIGIMNIMLVSVTERTKEIGIRKAIGAGRWEIMLQFLLEAFMVSMIGCAAGIGASFGMLKIIGGFMGDTAAYSVNIQVLMLAVGFSMVIGIVFGIYPANKAAGKKPVDALRF